jgi:hypothetical protein
LSSYLNRKNQVGFAIEAQDVKTFCTVCVPYYDNSRHYNYEATTFNHHRLLGDTDASYDDSSPEYDQPYGNATSILHSIPAGVDFYADSGGAWGKAGGVWTLHTTAVLLY